MHSYFLGQINRASAVFVGVYEPVKRTLLNFFPDHLSSLAHLVQILSNVNLSAQSLYYV